MKPFTTSTERGEMTQLTIVLLPSDKHSIRSCVRTCGRETAVKGVVERNSVLSLLALFQCEKALPDARFFAVVGRLVDRR
jgi:hypothetical protein